ncbi:MAG: prolyl oligopeptidase family serine peptidase [Pseudomonadota bacterium]
MSAANQDRAAVAANKQGAQCGAWPSPIGARLVANGAVPLSQLAIDGESVYWLAGRASEGGRTTLLRQRGPGTKEVTPAPLNVRTRVHEYGGGAYLAVDGAVFFSNDVDKRVYACSGDGQPAALSRPGSARHADFVLDRQRQRLIGVREDHAAGHAHPTNTICAINADGSETVLAQGADFYAAPRLSPDGATLAWLSWNHPNMPWQGSELWQAAVGADGSLAPARLVAGGVAESVCQPEWSPDGVLHFVSDRSGWWNLYALDGAAAAAGAARALSPRAAEFALPHWSFGVALYGFRAPGQIVCSYIENGISHLASLDCASGALRPIANPYQEIRELRVAAGSVVVLGGAPTLALEVARIDLASGARTVLARSIEQLPEVGDLSVPKAISYPSSNGRRAHAFFYQPCNARYQAAPGSLAPLIVIGHGGPTGMASNTLKLATQFWTSRGFAVLDVNYGGSSGFGRAYRDLLRGQWGVVDVEDCVAGARHLAARGLVDPERLLIRGSSAGGLTTLSALIFHDVFKAGACYYGVSDLAGLDADSHKFEAHYNAWLIAPQPEAQRLYLERSPIHHSDKLARPMIFFQGLDDKVVPPQQSEQMAAKLRARGVPVAYLTLEGEGHGFRKADSIAGTLEAELYFYRRIFALPSPEPLAPVAIDNLPA